VSEIGGKGREVPTSANSRVAFTRLGSPPAAAAPSCLQRPSVPLPSRPVPALSLPSPSSSISISDRYNCLDAVHGVPVVYLYHTLAPHGVHQRSCRPAASTPRSLRRRSTRRAPACCREIHGSCRAHQGKQPHLAPSAARTRTRRVVPTPGTRCPCCAMARRSPLFVPSPPLGADQPQLVYLSPVRRACAAALPYSALNPSGSAC
jgi:hypothetical protein